jgi:hypothetical protein
MSFGKFLLVAAVAYGVGASTWPATEEGLKNALSYPNSVSCVPVENLVDTMRCENFIVNGVEELITELQEAKAEAKSDSQEVPHVITCRMWLLPYTLGFKPVHSCNTAAG